VSHESHFRRLPAVHAILERPALLDAVSARGREAVARAVRGAIEEARASLSRGEDVLLDTDSLSQRASALLEADRLQLRPAINATGILLHTGLGRAPLAVEAAEAVTRVVRGYCNLELDLETGERGQRTSGVAELLARVTGAEAATVVNNNAAATVLALRAMAAGREVVVSRGQLVEIGGSFRLPEVFEVSGARLREVGTTNKTRLSDYAKAIGPETAALLKVHASNYRIVGFTEAVGIGDLAALARSRGLFAIDDIGSGALAPDKPSHVTGEPTVAEGLAAGADLVLFSGDKLLGGPQCGLLAGSKTAIQRVATDPLMRVVRVDKMTLAALEATLHLTLDPKLGATRIPLWAFLTLSVDRLRERAGRLVELLRATPGLEATVQETTAFLGGGSLPAEALKSIAVRVAPPFPPPVRSEGEFARALRLGEPAVVARLEGGSLLFDLRAMRDEDDAALAQAVANLFLGQR
jgi:L-seryl-tRNA(Ser) seleniumtransferase